MRIPAIASPDAEVARRARLRVDDLTKPLGSLGRIEDLAVRLSAIEGGVPAHHYERRAIIVGAGDHGIACEGVSAYPPEVTAQMVGGFCAGSAAISAFARAVGAEVFVADFGVAADLAPHARLFEVKVGRGTRNFAREPAMPVADVERSIAAGIAVFEMVRERMHPHALALGDMGIGNTTSAAAVVSALTATPAALVVGRGTGIDDERYARKVALVGDAVGRIGTKDPFAIAAAVGGYEIVGLAGAMLAAAAARTPVLLDGFIVGAAALLAQAIEPKARDYFIASHRSREQGHIVALRALGLEPLFDLDLRLGEASGAALAFPLLDAAARMIAEMKTFAEAGVSTSGAEVAAPGR